MWDPLCQFVVNHLQGYVCIHTSGVRKGAVTPRGCVHTHAEETLRESKIVRDGETPDSKQLQQLWEASSEAFTRSIELENGIDIKRKVKSKQMYVYIEIKSLLCVKSCVFIKKPIMICKTYCDTNIYLKKC